MNTTTPPSNRRPGARTDMKKLPSHVTMRKCSVQGIVFYADGCGEKTFSTAKQADEAYWEFRRQQDEVELKQRLTAPNTVVHNGSELIIRTDGAEIQRLPCVERHTARRLFNLSYLDTHEFILL